MERIFFGLNSFAQNLSLWNWKKCAVVVTYVDGLNVHLENVLSLLDSLGLKGDILFSRKFATICYTAGGVENCSPKWS
jgi:sialate O-acetylesterase